MTSEDTKSAGATSESKPDQKVLSEGTQPVNMVKVHQAIEFGQQPNTEMSIRGYSPQMSSLGPSGPPKGGSGVPPVKVEAQPSPASTQIEKKE